MIAAIWHTQSAWQICPQYIARNVSGDFFAPAETFGPEEQMNFRIVAAFQKARIPVLLLDRINFRYPKRNALDLVGIDNWRRNI